MKRPPHKQPASSKPTAEASPASRASDPPRADVRVLWSRTGVAILSAVVLGLAAYEVPRLLAGKSVDLPAPRYFPSKRNRPLAAGPLPTAAEAVTRPPERIATTVRPIEAAPGTEPLATFFRALARTDAKAPGAITRVCHWGDSQIVSDNITSTIRRRLQERFGDAGHGFLTVGTPSGYLQRDVFHWSKGWSIAGVARPRFRDQRYGLAGQVSYARDGAIARFETRDKYPVGKRVSRFEISYLAAPVGGRFDLRVDGGAPVVVNTRSTGDQIEERVHRLRLPDGPHRLALRTLGYGQVRLFGVVMERDVPGIVYDSLGLKGAQMHDLLRNDEAHFARQLRWRRPDLVVFGFGTNESYQRIPMSTYRTQWTRLLQRARAALPRVSCLVLGPVDRVYHRSRSHPRTLPLTRTFRQVALAQGCGFWDTFAAMGGEGAAVRWRRAGLLWGDLAHLNPKGGERLGALITTALLERYAAWKRRVAPAARRAGARPARASSRPTMDAPAPPRGR